MSLQLHPCPAGHIHHRTEFPKNMFIPDSDKADYPRDVVVQGRQEYTYMELEISTAGSISGCMSQYEGLSECSYAEFSGNIEGSKCLIKYEDDGYGHDGLLTFTFFEKILYFIIRYLLGVQFLLFFIHFKYYYYFI